MTGNDHRKWIEFANCLSGFFRLSLIFCTEGTGGPSLIWYFVQMALLSVRLPRKITPFLFQTHRSLDFHHSLCQRSCPPDVFISMAIHISKDRTPQDSAIRPLERLESGTLWPCFPLRWRIHSEVNYDDLLGILGTSHSNRRYHL